ncbi:hypothetical protein QBC36DRAFT_22750 [Triangularia setosa]|uniref:AAA+ ATPase domain-containing protein n=1 Tax=Triangularia setosa TaxID=2587417 RepID=A0AAN7A4X7_9PEZI|nr:hypothetical protein QBC36DRAFT_22750 [Podospora setosa]
MGGIGMPVHRPSDHSLEIPSDHALSPPNKPIESLHNVLTISRDKTSESDFQAQQLLAAANALENREESDYISDESEANNMGDFASDSDTDDSDSSTSARADSVPYSGGHSLGPFEGDPSFPSPIKFHSQQSLWSVTKAKAKSDEQPNSCHTGSSAIPRANSMLEPQKPAINDKIHHSDARRRQATKLRWEVIHRIDNKHLYLGQPYITIEADGSRKLHGELGLSNLARHIKRNSEVSFVVFRDYYTDELLNASRDRKSQPGGLPPGFPGSLPRPNPPVSLHPSPWRNETVERPRDDSIPFIYSESIKLVKKEMQDSVKALASLDGLDFILRSATASAEELQAPYFFWYFVRNQRDLVRTLPRKHWPCLRLLERYIETAFSTTYRHVDLLLSQGRIRYKYLPFLIRPGEPLVTLLGSLVGGCIADAMVHRDTAEDKASVQEQWTNKTAMYIYKILCHAWTFKNTSYAREIWNAIIAEHPASTAGKEQDIEIRSLRTYPLRFAEQEVRERLEKIGKLCWSSRVRKFVAYQESDGLEPERFMIDCATYDKIHGRQKGPIFGPGAVRISETTGPVGNEIYAFPVVIKGFNIQRKTWVDLDVDKITEVEWDKKAFENLALSDTKTKDLIQALVTTQVAAEKGTDIIKGKGKGLILLLHGAPGTGKTFTAEAVAEITEKPLYRVTCGDVGTKPEDVEKYLESVLYLGKIWGCIVLLDEAEVFLEQRGLADMNRNALVSVFLRVLEYYDGILVLTSNRVGTFDEAFKSRIHLAIHYDNLNVPQRRRIWRNFLARLKDIDGESIDFEDVYDNLDELARMEMNGRSIRNAITTARQLAKHKKEVVNSSHLQHVIEVASRFDDYIKKVREGLTDDELARDGGYR